jgi:hypothetical protein
VAWQAYIVTPDKWDRISGCTGFDWWSAIVKGIMSRRIGRVEARELGGITHAAPKPEAPEKQATPAAPTPRRRNG